MIGVRPVGQILILLAAQGVATAAVAQTTSPDDRARAIEERMTDNERFSMLSSLMVNIFGSGQREPRVPADLPGIAGYVPGVPRLGVPALKLADASLGMRYTGGPGAVGTALPSGLAMGASFNPALARDAGVLVAQELRARGFNVALGGGINLVREVRNGRNFEYYSEDPLLSALMGAESVIGTQSQGVIGLLKHVSLNASETNKLWLDAIIDPAAHRESDLLAFQIAIERAHPGALMCAYNKINGAYACGNAPILDDVIKKAWGYAGWIMSDWKAVYGWDYALKGLDQQSGAQLDDQHWFAQPLRDAYAAGKVSKERISDMVRRILRSMYAVGIDAWDKAPSVDMAAHNQIALEVARQGIVLLKNEGVLPLTNRKSRIAMIGGWAQLGVLSGDGSSQVMPPGGYAAQIPLQDDPLRGPTTMRFFPSAPLTELRRALPQATIAYDPGVLVADAVALAKASDVVIVNAIRHESERYDSPDLSLPFGQDALIEAVAAANPNTVVLLQTGNPVAMPWSEHVKAIVEAWYPGQAGGRAIADVLTGAFNPSGRLPITFPTDIAQTPFPKLPGSDVPLGTPMKVHYDEGAEIGYRWFAKTGAKPLFAFGHGCSYTRFAYSDFVVHGGDTVVASFSVTNIGDRAGADVPQLYLTKAVGDHRVRLLAFDRVDLKPGETRRVAMTADPRLLARFDTTAAQWRIAAGTYHVALGMASDDLVAQGDTILVARLFGR